MKIQNYIYPVLFAYFNRSVYMFKARLLILIRSVIRLKMPVVKGKTDAVHANSLQKSRIFFIEKVSKKSIEKILVVFFARIFFDSIAEFLFGSRVAKHEVFKHHPI